MQVRGRVRVEARQGTRDVCGCPGRQGRERGGVDDAGVVFGLGRLAEADRVGAVAGQRCRVDALLAELAARVLKAGEGTGRRLAKREQEPRVGAEADRQREPDPARESSRATTRADDDAWVLRAPVDGPDLGAVGRRAQRDHLAGLGPQRVAELVG